MDFVHDLPCDGRGVFDEVGFDLLAQTRPGIRARLDDDLGADKPLLLAEAGEPHAPPGDPQVDLFLIDQGRPVGLTPQNDSEGADPRHCDNAESPVPRIAELGQTRGSEHPGQLARSPRAFACRP